MKKRYRIVIGGVEHAFRLSDEEASERGLSPIEEKQAPAPKNKARKAVSNKTAEPSSGKD